MDSLWADTSGSFAGRVIDGVVEPEEFDPIRLQWHLRPADVTFPPTAGCSEPPIESWSFTGEMAEGVAANVTFTLTGTIGCVDTFAPSGTATIIPFTSPTCTTITWDPPAAPIAAADGSLVIDRSTSPSTFDARGETEWPATVTCAHPDGTTETQTFSIGGHWAVFRGEYDGDRWSSATDDYSRHFAWSFARPLD